jgi:methyltransferase (TIGR00027 family)
MKLPDLSKAMYVAHLRYVQSIHESQEHRSPDNLVRHLIPVLQRWRASWLGRTHLASLRAEPFYYYLLARTRYYDQVLTEALEDGVRRVVIVGCGSDTRAYRFEALLRSQGVKVLECDQPAAIYVKQRLAQRRWRCNHVEYLPIDLNDQAWPDLERWLGERNGAKTLVFMEGVSPYVDEAAFHRFLLLLADKLPTESHVAYDFKIRGWQDDFGRGGRTQNPFRLSQDADEVHMFHKSHGLRMERLELSSQLCARLLPGLTKSAHNMFSEDALVRLQVDSKGPPSGSRFPQDAPSP